MRLAPRFAAAAAVVVAVIVAVSACGSADGSHESSMSGSGSATSGSASAEAEVMFAQMMIPHHEQAVQMSTIALAKESASPDVKQLARQIQAAQGPEIQKMQGWLRQWGAPTWTPMDHSTDGMMSEKDMGALDSASGSDFDERWLTMMIAHHEGALTMARDVLSSTDKAEVVAMANNIVAGQEKEIATMQEMLGR